MLNRTTRNSVSLIDRKKNEYWKLQKFKWTKSQIVIVFYLDNWQAKNFLNEIITNIYNSFVLAEIFINFRNYFIFLYKFVIHQSICILWLDSDYLTTKYFNSFHSNNNVSKHSLCSDCHDRRSHIIESVIAISWNLILLFLSIQIKCISLFEMRKKIMQRMLYSARSARTSKSITTINFYNDEYEFLNVRRWRITFLFLIDNECFNIFDLNEFGNILLFILFDVSFSQLDIILYIIRSLEHIKLSLLFSWLWNLLHLIWKSI